MWVSLLRGWMRVRRGDCPLCNSHPPKKFCSICHGELMPEYEIIPKVQDAWWDSYKKLIYIRTDRKRGELS